jgi:hypothetical protein
MNNDQIINNTKTYLNKSFILNVIDKAINYIKHNDIFIEDNQQEQLIEINNIVLENISFKSIQFNRKQTNDYKKYYITIIFKLVNTLDIKITSNTDELTDKIFNDLKIKDFNIKPIFGTGLNYLINYKTINYNNKECIIIGNTIYRQKINKTPGIILHQLG